MANTIDARGLSCPQPVIMTINEIKKIKTGEVIITVDTDTAKENVSRASLAHGWTIADTRPLKGGYEITIRRED